MSEELKIGASGELEWLVAAEHCTRRGEEDIFSTPNLVRLLEEASIEALAPYLTAEQGSVGSRVEVKHLAATPRGMTVRARAEVTEIDRRRVVFQVLIDDEVERIGEAIHERFIVDLERFEARVKAKRQAVP